MSKVYMLQTKWDLVLPEAEGWKKRRYFKTRKAALRAEKEHNKFDWCLGTRIVEIKVEG